VCKHKAPSALTATCAGEWQSVSPLWRDAYSLAELLVAAASVCESLVAASPRPHSAIVAAVEAALRAVDLALIMGGRRFSALAHRLISLLVPLLPQPAAAADAGSPAPSKRQRVEDSACANAACDAPLSAADALPGGASAGGVEIARREAPALETFLREHFEPQTPGVLTGLVGHWPALDR